MQRTLGWFAAEMRVQDRKSNSFYIELSPANVDQSKQCCYSANERTHMLQTFSQSGTVIEEVTWIKKSGTNRGKLERIHLYIFSYYGRVPWSTSQYHGLRVPVGQSLVPRTWMMSPGALIFFKRLLPFFGNNHVHLWFFVGTGIKNFQKPHEKHPKVTAIFIRV